MDLYKKSFSMAVSTGSSPDESLAGGFPTVTLARIATSDTLKMTLGLSRKESYWRLLHSRTGSEELMRIPIASGPSLRRQSRLVSYHQSLPFFPASTPCSPQAALSPSRLPPSERDYHRMLLRLNKILSGSAFSMRTLVLSEEKSTELSLETEEWQYFRIKTQGKAVPMKVLLRRSKGRVLVYLSRTVQEPKESMYDELHTRDVILVSELGSRFKLPWVFLGMKCLEEVQLTVSVCFGVKHKKQKPTSPHSSLADLDELRKDETKREELFKHVDSLLALRQESLEAKFRSRNFIQENKNIASRPLEGECHARRELEQTRRGEAAKKRQEHLKAKRLRAEQYMKRRELRTATEAQVKAEMEVRGTQQRFERCWLSLAYFFAGSEAMWARFLKKSEDLDWVRIQIRSAIMLQSFYRRMGATINPKKMTKQRALDHLLLCFHSVAPLLAAEARRKVFLTIQRDEEAHCVQDALLTFHAKMTLIQVMWRRYVHIKRGRIDQLMAVWTEALRLLVPDATNKKQQKRAKELEAKYQKVDQMAVLQAHLKSCQRHFYKAIHSYIKANRAFRQGVKAFIFSKLKRGEAVYLSGAPDFRFLLSVPEMQKLIEAQAESACS